MTRTDWINAAIKEIDAIGMGKDQKYANALADTYYDEDPSRSPQEALMEDLSYA